MDGWMQMMSREEGYNGSPDLTLLLAFPQGAGEQGECPSSCEQGRTVPSGLWFK